MDTDGADDERTAEEFSLPSVHPERPQSPTAPLFLSYAREDQDRVASIVESLQLAGLAVWIDRDGIVGGGSYGSQIAAAIRQSPAFLLCMTPAALASRNVRREIALAWKHERPIIPLLLQTTEVPAEIEYWLEATQFIEVLNRTEGEWLPRLANAIAGLGVTASTTFDQPSKSSIREVSLSNLPLQPPTVIGRVDEISEISGLLDSGVRLLTLIGPGGVGKTTLAIAVAHALRGQYPGGVWFVDLAPVRNVEGAVAATALAAGLRDLGVNQTATVLGRYLSPLPALALFDNSEHLPEIGLVISDLLASAPGLTVLVTGRRLLHLRNERAFHVHPFPVPAVKDLAEIISSPAVALFAERAVGVAPSFAVQADNASQVAEICRKLDGLPLAIELAAVRMQLFTPEQLLTRLEQNQVALEAEVIDAPARQRTLRDTVAWSVELLQPEEQQLFRRLAVFNGGFTFDAAEKVTGESTNFIAGMSKLVDNSLLERVDTDAGVRFSMLTSIRDYARELFEADPGFFEISDRHAGWCLDLSHEFWLGAEKNVPTWRQLQRIELEFPNIRSALDWLSVNGDETRYKQIAVNMVAWEMFDQPEIREIFRKAPNKEETTDPILRARFLTAQLFIVSDDLEERELVEPTLDAVSELYIQQNDLYGQGVIQHIRASIHAGKGEWDLAQRCSNQALTTFLALSKPGWVNLCLVSNGALAFYRGDLDYATSVFRQLKGKTEADKDYQKLVSVYLYSSLIAALEGDKQSAHEFLEYSLELVRDSRSVLALAGWAFTATFCLIRLDRFSQRDQIVFEIRSTIESLGYDYEFMLPDFLWTASRMGIDMNLPVMAPEECRSLPELADFLEKQLLQLATETAT